MAPQNENSFLGAASGKTVEDEPASEQTGTAVTVVDQQVVENEPVSEGVEASSWQTECGGLSARLEVVLVRGLWHDCELIVGAAAERFQAHRVILASASPVLANKLSIDPRRPIILPNIKSDTFKLILEYLYTDKVNLTSCDAARNVYQAAHDLILPHLQSKIKTYVLNNITTEHVIQIYEFSEKFGLNDVKEKALEKMTMNAQDVLEGVGIETAQADTLERMFAIPNLNISSELQLIKAAERWVRARSKVPTTHQNNELHGMGDAKPMADKLQELDAKSSIQDALKQIRFLAMTPEEFAACDLSYLLHESDVLAIALNLLSSKTYMPIPVGFSTVKQQHRWCKIYQVKIKNVIQQTGQTQYLIADDDNVKWYLLLDKPTGDSTSRLSNARYRVIPQSIVGIRCEPNTDFAESCYAKIDVSIPCTKDAEGNSQFHWSKKGIFNFYEKFNLEDKFNWTHVADPANGYVCDGYVTFEVQISSVQVRLG